MCAYGKKLHKIATVSIRVVEGALRQDPFKKQNSQTYVTRYRQL